MLFGAYHPCPLACSWIERRIRATSSRVAAATTNSATATPDTVAIESAVVIGEPAHQPTYTGDNIQPPTGASGPMIRRYPGSSGLRVGVVSVIKAYPSC